MASSLDFIHYVCEQLDRCGMVTYKKMLGDYMISVNAKPIILVCDNTVFVKKSDCIADKLCNAEEGEPYPGAKIHYILDIDDRELAIEVVQILEKVTPLTSPKKAKRK